MGSVSHRASPFRMLVPAVVAALLAALLLSGVTALSQAARVRAGHGTYTNPLNMTSEVGPVENCADPTVGKARENGVWAWYMYCTKDPRNDEDRDGGGNYVFQLIPIYRSTDLVNWTYEGNVFQPEDAANDNYPDWAEPNAGLFAPEIKRMNGKWYLYYTVTDTKPGTGDPDPGCVHDPAIGVATAPTPSGPWTDSGDPVIDPRDAGEGVPWEFPCDRRWYATIDPEVQTVDGQRYIFWGSYFGGIFARELTWAGFESRPATEQQITIGDKFEGPEIIRRGGYYYLFVSATNCCNVELTAYGVFAGRSPNILGPYVDKDGVPLLDFHDIAEDPTNGAAGGTPVLQMNGNKWVGVGHNTVFKDFQGKWWTIYHAVNLHDPNFEGARFFTKRPALLDPIVWVPGGWPEVRAGKWASGGPMPAPAAQPGQTNHYVPKSPWHSQPGELLEAYSDEFNGSSLDTTQWSWVREPDPATYEVADGQFRWDTQAADLHTGSNNASVLIQETPPGEWVLQARLRMVLPAEGCCPVFRQGGVVVYENDDSYLKLAHVAIFPTRQIEWAKEVPPGDGPAYGNGIVGPPGVPSDDPAVQPQWTDLRIVKIFEGNHEEYQAWSRRQGGSWVRGPTWRHNLGEDAKIGLISMGGPDFQSQFEWVRMYRLELKPPIVPFGEF